MSTKYECNDVEGVDYSDAVGDNWYCHTFTPQTTHYLNMVKLFLFTNDVGTWSEVETLSITYEGMEYYGLGLGIGPEATYANAHDASEATYPTLAAEYGMIIELRSMYMVDLGYHVSRGYISFDTSSLGAIEIVEAILQFYVNGKYGEEAEQATIHIVQGVHNDVLTLADFGKLKAKTVSGGSIDYDDLVIGWNEISLNVEGMEWINKTGTTRLGLRLSGDVNNNIPTEWNDIILSNPILTIYYTPSSDVVVGIQHTTGDDNHPGNTDLTSATFARAELTTDPAAEWKEIELLKHRVNKDTMYAMVLRMPDAEKGEVVNWWFSGDGDAYPRGSAGISYDAGVTWDMVSGAERDFLFEEWGDPVVAHRHHPTIPTEPNRGKESSKMGSL